MGDRLAARLQALAADRQRQADQQEKLKSTNNNNSNSSSSTKSTRSHRNLVQDSVTAQALQAGISEEDQTAMSLARTPALPDPQVAEQALERLLAPAQDVLRAAMAELDEALAAPRIQGLTARRQKKKEGGQDDGSGGKKKRAGAGGGDPFAPPPKRRRTDQGEDSGSASDDDGAAGDSDDRGDGVAGVTFLRGEEERVIRADACEGLAARDYQTMGKTAKKRADELQQREHSSCGIVGLLAGLRFLQEGFAYESGKQSKKAHELYSSTNHYLSQTCATFGRKDSLFPRGDDGKVLYGLYNEVQAVARQRLLVLAHSGLKALREATLEEKRKKTGSFGNHLSLVQLLVTGADNAYRAEQFGGESALTSVPALVQRVLPRLIGMWNPPPADS